MKSAIKMYAESCFFLVKIESSCDKGFECGIYFPLNACPIKMTSCVIKLISKLHVLLTCVTEIEI